MDDRHIRIGRSLILGTVAAYVIDPQYDATTRFLPPVPKTTANLSLLSTNTRAGDHYLRFVSSRTVADDVIEHQHLMEYFHARNITQARRGLAAMSKAVVYKDEFVTVTVRAKEPQTAVNIAMLFFSMLIEERKSSWMYLLEGVGFYKFCGGIYGFSSFAIGRPCIVHISFVAQRDSWRDRSDPNCENRETDCA